MMVTLWLHCWTSRPLIDDCGGGLKKGWIALFEQNGVSFFPPKKLSCWPPTLALRYKEVVVLLSASPRSWCPFFGTVGLILGTSLGWQRSRISWLPASMALIILYQCCFWFLKVLAVLLEILRVDKEEPSDVSGVRLSGLIGGRLYSLSPLLLSSLRLKCLSASAKTEYNAAP